KCQALSAPFRATNRPPQPGQTQSQAKPRAASLMSTMRPELRSFPNASQSACQAIAPSPPMGEASSVTRAGAANQHKPDDNPLAGETELGLLQRWLDENSSDALGWAFLHALVVEST